MSPPVLTYEEMEKLCCPQCGGRKFDTYCLEGTEQTFVDGDWGDVEFTDEIFPIRITCQICKAVVVDRSAEAKAAIREELDDRPRRQQQAEELAKWAETKGIDVEFLADEAVLDYYSGQGAGVLNEGAWGILECLLEIYQSPEAVKAFLSENAGMNDEGVAAQVSKEPDTEIEENDGKF